MSIRFDNLEKQQHEVQDRLLVNGLSYEVAVWLADLHTRVRQCELALINHGLGVEQPLRSAPETDPVSKDDSQRDANAAGLASSGEEGK